MKHLITIVRKHDDLSEALKNAMEFFLVLGGTILIAPTIMWMATL